ncbi:MSMEG_0569 family flavin-dependent oxidoreductase [filamentous cyanobacterium LEGE 11480]|uniref:MSMEG_0569 family flavin-dependent oxidoreductase n=1 Tax=Romeriopsis navalis LEGE 11480 TaxID=2777977 RepID=A0A928VLQ7_9CYAN|nr:MSMEG_0569 family flavin-dependent oxidoreductase [Romeriopsis navalis]MBE9028825.1 MSMEG_0569 family flavin-dependent oxidoreductase [Romeriopsis navalis LEGE 11480]
MSSHYSVIVIGGGQAGLSVSYCLRQRQIDHLVFEQHQIAHSWRSKRWDTFCLVTPNWQCQLPGYHYAGDDTNGFMQRDEIVQYIESYAQQFNPPVREGVTVERVAKNPISDVFEITTSSGEFTADQIVVATGGYHRPRIPTIAQRLPESMHQIHSSEYKNAQALPAGAVLVVGTGQSGCQIAEDLHLEGRQVHLAVGSAPRSPRRYRGKDVVDWLDQLGYYDITVDEHPQKEQVRHKTNHYVTGRGGGREIDLRHFALAGMQLHGRLQTIHDNQQIEFQPNLQQHLDQADAVAESIKQTIDEYIATQQIDAPTEAPYKPAWEPPADQALTLDYQAANITTVIWSIGYDMDFSWVEIPVFDGRGYPGHDRGVTSVSGLYFVGLPWLHTWGSGRFSGIARDVQYVADYIQSKHRRSSRSEYRFNAMAIGS